MCQWRLFSLDGQRRHFTRPSLSDWRHVSVGAEDIRQCLAANLRRLSQAAGLSEEAFARETGLHRTYVSDIERAACNPAITVRD